MRIIKPVILGILATIAASAQVAINGPMEGFLFDAPTGSFRVVTGLAGSATLGPAILGGFDFGSVAPHQSFAIAFLQGKYQVVTSLDSASPSAAFVSGLVAKPDGAAWSADGTLAILYSRSGNWMQTVTGLPGSPASGAYVDISTLGGTLSSVASSPQGKQIAVAVNGAAGGVYLSGDSQTFVPVLQSPSVIALAFSADGTNLYALDSAVPQLTVVDLSTLSSRNLALSGLANPVALRSDQDAQGRPIAYIASGNDRLLRIIDVGSQQALTDVSLNVVPAEIDTLGLYSFVIASRSQTNQPLWLFSSGPVPAAYFVPAPNRPDRRIHTVAGGL